jgi:hypothetical protein
MMDANLDTDLTLYKPLSWFSKSRFVGSKPPALYTIPGCVWRALRNTVAIPKRDQSHDMAMDGHPLHARERRSNLSSHRLGCYWSLGVVVGNGVAAGAGVTLEISNRFFQTPPSRTAIDPV